MSEKTILDISMDDVNEKSVRKEEKKLKLEEEAFRESSPEFFALYKSIIGTKFSFEEIGRQFNDAQRKGIDIDEPIRKKYNQLSPVGKIIFEELKF